MLRALACFCLASLISSAAFAQVLYLPVQSQFRTGSGDQTYFYGGNDPRVHIMAHGDCAAYGYANNLHRFDGGNSFGQSSPIYDRTQVFTDCIPFQNAARFGYTAADAENEARANAATYFRKADILAAAIRTPDGALIVPPTPTPVFVTPVRPMQPTTNMTTMPARGSVIIIPKRLLDRPLKEFTNPQPQKVASAR